MSVSGFIASMVEAGWKKFDQEAVPDRTNEELREANADLREELEHARRRVERLEDQVYDSEQGDIVRFVRQNPGATWDEVLQHLSNSLSERTTRHLDGMEGELLERGDDGGYYARSEREK
jgi:signal transduction histidine kinase